MENAPYRWDEAVASGSISQDMLSFDTGSAQCTLTIRVQQYNSRMLRQMISHILGTAKIEPGFNNANPSAQGPYRLSRLPPARHPRYRGLFANKILSITGKGLEKINPRGEAEKERVGNGYIGCHGVTEFKIQFGLPLHRILQDHEMMSTPYDVTDPRPEYHRFVEWSYETNYEAIARKGAVWYFHGVKEIFAGDRHLRIPKGKLSLKWLDVPEAFIMNGGLIPRNILKCVGKLNAKAFPAYKNADTQSQFRDQNDAAGVFVNFPPGTLLMMPPKIMPKTQVNPSILGAGTIDRLALHYAQRTVDVEFSLLHFDPITYDNVKVDLSHVNGDAQTVIRGHQLMAKPSTNKWHVGTLKTEVSGGVIIGATPDTDDQLLYQYADFEAAFSAVTSS